MTLSGQASHDVLAGRHGCCESQLNTMSLSSNPIPARHHRLIVCLTETWISEFTIYYFLVQSQYTQVGSELLPHILVGNTFTDESVVHLCNIRGLTRIPGSWNPSPGH